MNDLLNENEFINKSMIDYFKKTKLIFKYNNDFLNIQFYSIKKNIKKIKNIKKCIERIKLLLKELNNNYNFNIIIIDYNIKRKMLHTFELLFFLHFFNFSTFYFFFKFFQFFQFFNFFDFFFLFQT